MPNMTDPDKSALVKTGKLTTIGGAALAIVAVQFVAFGAFMDILSSVAIFGIGYLAGRITR